MENIDIQVTHTETRKFGKLVVIAEFSDTDKGWFYRLRSGERKTDWSRCYEGFAQLMIGERLFLLFTPYWTNECLPTEVPVEVVNGTRGIK